MTTDNCSICRDRAKLYHAQIGDTEPTVCANCQAFFERYGLWREPKGFGGI